MSKRYTSFVFTLRPTAEQEATLWRHAGAARFAYNQSLALHIAAKRARAERPDTPVPYSGFDFINAFNAWKRSARATTGEDEPPGLPWRHQVFQGVFEEACRDLGRALEGRAAWFKGGRKGRCPGPARFKKRGRCRASFRVRNKLSHSKTGPRGTVRFRPLRHAPSACPIPHRAVQLPGKLGGVVRLREDTRRLRRVLAKSGTVLRFVTLSHDGRRWRLSANVQTSSLHEGLHAPRGTEPVGIDRGLSTFAVLATASGKEVERIDHPRPLRGALSRLRRLSRAHARKVLGSANRRRAQRRLQRLHARLRHVRQDFVHRVTSRLAKTHDQLVLETLNTRGLMRTRLARSLADSAWAQFATKLSYKMSWYGGVLTLAERTFPSTRRCSNCGHVGPKVPLSVRRFRCGECGFEADRDTNAAINLGQVPELDTHAAREPAGEAEGRREL